MARKMTEWPSKRGPITKIMPSDGCIGDTVPLAVGKWYDFHEFGWYMGNVGLMVIGYKAADDVPLWDLGGWAVNVNNALMLVAVAFIGTGNSKSRLREKIRHPMLTGVLVWVVAHLLVNGDLASLVLFGGLGMWAVGAFVLINRAEPDHEPWQGGTRAGDIRLVIISIVVFAVIVGIHSLIGPSPFPGGAA